MNDRFKFRAWNKAENMYHYNAECAYDSMGGTPPLMHDSFGGVLDDDNFVVEQCTGLRDKNGKMIYEGDVVRCDIDFVPDGRVDLIRTVIFKDGAFQLSSKDGGFYFIMGFHNIEIIGNIHEMEVPQ